MSPADRQIVDNHNEQSDRRKKWLYILWSYVLVLLVAFNVTGFFIWPIALTDLLFSNCLVLLLSMAASGKFNLDMLDLFYLKNWARKRLCLKIMLFCVLYILSFGTFQGKLVWINGVVAVIFLWTLIVFIIATVGRDRTKPVLIEGASDHKDQSP